MRYFAGIAGSSVKNQPPIFAGDAVGLYNSTESSVGASVCVKASLMTIPAAVGAGSSAPGEPFGFVLARQLEGLFGFAFAFGLRETSEKPRPSGVKGQRPLSLYSTENSRVPRMFVIDKRSPPLSNRPV